MTKPKLTLISFVAIVAALLTITAVIHYMNLKKVETVTQVNDNLSVDKVKLYMTESELISVLGEGEYVEGFGGHQRNYIDKEIRIGIAGDGDNDYYGRVSQIEISNPEYALYGIRVGDSADLSRSKLLDLGYKHIIENIYRSGEFAVAIHGLTKVNLIQIWFYDKDLRDRVY